MRNSTQPQHEVRDTPAESFGRIARCTAVATPVLLEPARRSANQADIASVQAGDASARRAQTASGFGDATLTGGGDTGHRAVGEIEQRSIQFVERPTARQLEAAARLDRSRRVGQLVLAVWRAVAQRLRRGVIRQRQRPEPRNADLAPPVGASIAFAPGDSPLLYKTAGMRELIADISQRVVGVVRPYFGAWRQRRQAWETYKALRELDARTVRDIGLDRSELRSIAAEVSGALDVTRMHAVHVERSF
jgi:uncharacterized protein YjiS (DUF1127 family)